MSKVVVEERVARSWQPQPRLQMPVIASMGPLHTVTPVRHGQRLIYQSRITRARPVSQRETLASDFCW